MLALRLEALRMYSLRRVLTLWICCAQGDYGVQLRLEGFPCVSDLDPVLDVPL